MKNHIMICNRCKARFARYRDERCPECGVHKDRLVKSRFRCRRHRPGKRGRNSGTTGTAKNKKA